jgi:uncharacterized coiled-coil protein SlyX
MSIQDAAKELNKAFKKEWENKLEDNNEKQKNVIATLSREIEEQSEKIDTLEKIIIDLVNRVEYLENRCQ